MLLATSDTMNSRVYEAKKYYHETLRLQFRTSKAYLWPCSLKDLLVSTPHGIDIIYTILAHPVESVCRSR